MSGRRVKAPATYDINSYTYDDPDSKAKGGVVGRKNWLPWETTALLYSVLHIFCNQPTRTIDWDATYDYFKVAAELTQTHCKGVLAQNVGQPMSRETYIYEHVASTPVRTKRDCIRRYENLCTSARKHITVLSLEFDEFVVEWPDIPTINALLVHTSANPHMYALQIPTTPVKLAFLNNEASRMKPKLYESSLILATILRLVRSEGRTPATSNFVNIYAEDCIGSWLGHNLPIECLQYTTSVQNEEGVYQYVPLVLKEFPRPEESASSARNKASHSADASNSDGTSVATLSMRTRRHSALAELRSRTGDTSAPMTRRRSSMNARLRSGEYISHDDEEEDEDEDEEEEEDTAAVEGERRDGKGRVSSGGSRRRVGEGTSVDDDEDYEEDMKPPRKQANTKARPTGIPQNVTSIVISNITTNKESTDGNTDTKADINTTSSSSSSSSGDATKDTTTSIKEDSTKDTTETSSKPSTSSTTTETFSSTSNSLSAALSDPSLDVDAIDNLDDLITLGLEPTTTVSSNDASLTRESSTSTSGIDASKPTASSTTTTDTTTTTATMQTRKPAASRSVANSATTSPAVHSGAETKRVRANTNTNTNANANTTTSASSSSSTPNAPAMTTRQTNNKRKYAEHQAQAQAQAQAQQQYQLQQQQQQYQQQYQLQQQQLQLQTQQHHQQLLQQQQQLDAYNGVASTGYHPGLSHSNNMISAPVPVSGHLSSSTAYSGHSSNNNMYPHTHPSTTVTSGLQPAPPGTLTSPAHHFLSAAQRGHQNINTHAPPPPPPPLPSSSSAAASHDHLNHRSSNPNTNFSNANGNLLSLLASTAYSGNPSTSTHTTSNTNPTNTNNISQLLSNAAYMMENGISLDPTAVQLLINAQNNTNVLNTNPTNNHINLNNPVSKLLLANITNNNATLLNTIQQLPLQHQQLLLQLQQQQQQQQQQLLLQLQQQQQQQQQHGLQGTLSQLYNPATVAALAPTLHANTPSYTNPAAPVLPVATSLPSAPGLSAPLAPPSLDASGTLLGALSSQHLSTSTSTPGTIYNNYSQPLPAAPPQPQPHPHHNHHHHHNHPSHPRPTPTPTPPTPPQISFPPTSSNPITPGSSSLPVPSPVTSTPLSVHFATATTTTTNALSAVPSIPTSDLSAPVSEPSVYDTTPSPQTTITTATSTSTSTTAVPSPASHATAPKLPLPPPPVPK